MISERKFAHSFTSFWREVLPRADGYLRRINLSAERYRPPVRSNLPVERESRAIVNELAFRLFMHMAQGKNLTSEEQHIVGREVCRYIQHLTGTPARATATQMTEDELSEARDLCIALAEFFSEQELRGLRFWPAFRGCGCIEECKADIVSETCLIEVKAGDRSFRITDLRQILVYCSLDFAAGEYHLDAVSIVNPRRGVYYEAPIKEVAQECSGLSEVDLFSEIIAFLTAEATSH